MDAFLASVEVALCPELRGRPVVVGGSPRSRNLVMSCSYEARRFGVRPGMALAEAARRCRGAVFRDGDAQAANRMRERVVRVLLEFTPRVEVASIDDFFADLTGTGRLHGCAFDAAVAIHKTVLERCGLPLTVGVATQRTLARLAGKLAKPGGVAEVLPGYEAVFLAPLPVEHLPGVGHAIGARLERFGIRTAGELARVPRELLFASFGRNGLVLHERARGRDDTPVEPTHQENERGELVVRPPRSLQRETTFEPEEGRREILEAMLSYLVERAAHRLRHLGLEARTIEVVQRWVDTRPRRAGGLAPPEGLTAHRRRTLAAPTDATGELWHAAHGLWRELPRRRTLVKRLGLRLTNLTPTAGWQGRLFDQDPSPTAERSRADRLRRLDDAVDQLRRRLGFGSVLRGSSTPLAATHPRTPDGFRLRTPSLNQ